MSNFNFPSELAPDLSPEGLEKLSQLGPVRQTYLSDRALRWRNARLLWIFIGFFLLLGLWVIVGILSRKDWEKHVGGFGVIAGMWLIVFSVCGWRLLVVRRSKEARVIVCAEGLAKVVRGDLTLCRWEDVESVMGTAMDYRAGGMLVGRRHRISVSLVGGGKLTLDSSREYLANMDSLLGTIYAESTRRMYPRLLAQLEAGETVTFDGLGLSKEGLHFLGRLLPWEEVETIRSQRFLNIREKNARPWSWWNRRQFQIPNLPVFVSLANHYLKTTPPAQDAQ